MTNHANRNRDQNAASGKRDTRFWKARGETGEGTDDQAADSRQGKTITKMHDMSLAVHRVNVAGHEWDGEEYPDHRQGDGTAEECTADGTQ